jgi:cytochrome c-type biogenesis protein CcmH
VRGILAIAAAILATCAWGQSSEIANPDPVVESRLKAISEELRCLVCQNQTIADSHATLAVDLRQQIRAMVGAGKTDAEIRAYMVQRYGDFVLYNPPFQPNTLVLWLGPAILIVGGAAALAITIRRRGALPVARAPDEAQRREIESLLAGGEAVSAQGGTALPAIKTKGGKRRP